MKSANSSLKCCFTFCHSHLKDWTWFLARIVKTRNRARIWESTDWGSQVLTVSWSREEDLCHFYQNCFFLTLCWFLSHAHHYILKWGRTKIRVSPRVLESTGSHTQVLSKERIEVRLGVLEYCFLFSVFYGKWKFKGMTFWIPLSIFFFPWKPCFVIISGPQNFFSLLKFLLFVEFLFFVFLVKITIFNKNGRVISLCHTS